MLSGLLKFSLGSEFLNIVGFPFNLTVGQGGNDHLSLERGRFDGRTIAAMLELR